MGSYLRPTSLPEALAALAATPRIVLAGGTDYYPARVGRPPEDDLLDITAIPALAGIAETEEGWRIGAATTWTEVVEAPLPPLFDGLKAAAREVGGAQIQNAGTVAGNLCNASPAADGIPNLLALGATVHLASASGDRVLPVAEFVHGNRRTARRADEIVTAIHIPGPKRAARSVFLKLGARRYLVISIVMVAAVAEFDEDGTIASARIAVGSCSAAAVRLPALEAALAGQRPDPALVAEAHLAPLSPIDDVRASAAYRRDAALTLLRRAVEALR
ncbi:FAD binding domain-containing protein [Elioraea rosea]|uniref:FAD binding domain-containing protein n=1 Tax=Elioraea rosea TaxID=2492390 RepID=UPI0011849400|nr:FAD binding domain-containing protein [Elioraea rosea]